MKNIFTLYCKSYRVDLRRVMRLAQSVAEFNNDKIPFYISVPKSDLSLFRQHLDGLAVEIIEDEAILARTPYNGQNLCVDLPGHISQQVIKSEFWRLELAESYLCLDSDAKFIRPFEQSEFIWQSGIPYTVMDEAHDYLENSLAKKKENILDAFRLEALKVQSLIGRQGRIYSFGPFPLPWHRRVWESLEHEFLRPQKLNLIDAIKLAPLESRWYAEALLSYQAIPLMPCQPLFKVYHHAWEYDRDQRLKIDEKKLAQIYSGVIYQSAWERSMDWPSEGGHFFSRLGRSIRRKMGRI